MNLKMNLWKKLKAFGFTKYHPKAFKDTDYLFLDIYKNKIKMDKQKVIDLKDLIRMRIDQSIVITLTKYW